MCESETRAREERLAVSEKVLYPAVPLVADFRVDNRLPSQFVSPPLGVPGLSPPAPWDQLTSAGHKWPRVSFGGGSSHRDWAHLAAAAQHAARGPVSYILLVFSAQTQTCTSVFWSAARCAMRTLHAHSATCSVRGHRLPDLSRGLPSQCRADATGWTRPPCQWRQHPKQCQPDAPTSASLTNTHAEEGSEGSTGCAAVGAARRRLEEQDRSTPATWFQPRQYAP